MKRNRRHSRGSLKFRRPERAYAAVLISPSGMRTHQPYLVPIGEPRLQELVAIGKSKELTWIDKHGGIGSTTHAALSWSLVAEKMGQL